jgi:hypothetical protein
MAPGQGDVSIRVRIVGSAVTSNAVAYSYQSPCLAYIDGPGASGASTLGGDAVRLHGDNFGPVGTVVDYAAYGHSVVAGSPPFHLTTASTPVYLATSCHVSEAHRSIDCVTAAGVGSGLAWTVSVSGQVLSLCSGAGATNVSSGYGAPVIDSVVVASTPDAGVGLLSSEGGSVVTVTGRNFGVGFDNAVSVTFDDVTLPLSALVDGSAGSMIRFVAPPGSGRAKPLIIAVDGLRTATNTQLSYSPPAVTGVFALEGWCPLY